MNDAHQDDLFCSPDIAGLYHLRAFASASDEALIEAVERISAEAVPRRMTVPGGGAMSVAMTNCGDAGWVSDSQGYRYAPLNPATGLPWPAMPQIVRDLAVAAAAMAGFAGFAPDACLINLYEPGARMGLHQDRNEANRDAPIVSISLGLPTTFLFGGLRREDRVQKLVLLHGDVVVWGGPARLAYHGVSPLKSGVHHRLGRQRINLTVRQAK